MSAEVASTRLPKEILREIDREAARRGISRSVYLADVIERGALREPSADAAGAAEALRAALTSELREIREGQRSLSHALRDLQAALNAGPFPSSRRVLVWRALFLPVLQFSIVSCSPRFSRKR